MPPFETMDLVDSAVLWEKSGVDRYGSPTVGSPSDVKVRWVNRRTDMKAADGTRVTVDAQVVYSDEIPLGSEMWLGTLEDWYGTGSSGTDDEVMTVVAWAECRDIKGRITRREYGLTRSKDGPS